MLWSGVLYLSTPCLDTTTDLLIMSPRTSSTCLWYDWHCRLRRSSIDQGFLSVYIGSLRFRLLGARTPSAFSFFFFLSYSLLARRAHFPHFFMTNSCPRVCAREGGGRRVSSLPLYPPAFHYSLTCVDVSVRLVYVPRFDRIRPASFHRQPCNCTLSPDFQIFISRSFYFYFFAYFFFPFPLHHFLSHSPWILISIRRGDGVGILFWTKSYRENWA